MSNEATAGVLVNPLRTEADRNVWMGKPLLPGSDAGYRGTIRSEVWADGFVCVAMTDPRLIAPALAALHDAMPSTTTVRELSAQPLMMDRPTAAFLGRVVIEFWVGGAP